jgi:hypothetical protein
MSGGVRSERMLRGPRQACPRVAAGFSSAGARVARLRYRLPGPPAKRPLPPQPLRADLLSSDWKLCPRESVSKRRGAPKGAALGEICDEDSAQLAPTQVASCGVSSLLSAFSGGA